MAAAWTAFSASSGRGSCSSSFSVVSVLIGLVSIGHSFYHALETSLQLVHHLSSADVPGEHGTQQPSCSIQRCHLSVLHQCCCSQGILPACRAILIPQPFAIAAWETAEGPGPGEQGAGKWRSQGITQAKQEPEPFGVCWVWAMMERLTWIWGEKSFCKAPRVFVLSSVSPLSF